MHFFTLPILALLASAAYAKYYLADDYSPSNFASKFNFFTGNDSANGYVNYIDQNAAESLGLFKQQDGKVYMGVDSTTVASGRGRNSVRLSSKAKYTHGLFILDLNHVPDNQCGSRSSFLAFDPNCSNISKTGIFSGIINAVKNTTSLFTNLVSPITNIHSEVDRIEWSNCDIKAPTNAKCDIKSDSTKVYNSSVNAVGGGVHVTEWTNDTIRAWFFPRSNIPSDITSGRPNPGSWGTPLVDYSVCDFDKYFGNLSIIFDMTFCDDWAGNMWKSISTCMSKAPLCTNYVKNNPTAFKDVYWLISSLKIYQDNPNLGNDTSVGSPSTNVSATSPPVNVSASSPPDNVPVSSTPSNIPSSSTPSN
ncbi:hypothetical protein FO519_009930, partial [Halicephalobus sp. NKZ332]